MGYHDAAEDHGGMLRLKDIEHNFGKNVARMVEGLSDSLTDDPGNKQSWQMRKESYIERLRDPRPRAVYGTDTLFTLAENSPLIVAPECMTIGATAASPAGIARRVRRFFRQHPITEHIRANPLIDPCTATADYFAGVMTMFR